MSEFIKKENMFKSNQETLRWTKSCTSLPGHQRGQQWKEALKNTLTLNRSNYEETADR